MKNIATLFGTSLDQDDFEITKGLIHKGCQYIIGETKLVGPIEICNSYEQNMLEGRKKLDELEWGKSKIETISNTEFYVHFTDYLTHKGEKYIHRCKQKLTIGEDGKITRIEHIHDEKEQKQLNEYYVRVGIKPKNENNL